MRSHQHAPSQWGLHWCWVVRSHPTRALCTCIVVYIPSPYEIFMNTWALWEDMVVHASLPCEVCVHPWWCVLNLYVESVWRKDDVCSSFMWYLYVLVCTYLHVGSVCIYGCVHSSFIWGLCGHMAVCTYGSVCLPCMWALCEHMVMYTHTSCMDTYVCTHGGMNTE